MNENTQKLVTDKEGSFTECGADKLEQWGQFFGFWCGMSCWFIALTVIIILAMTGDIERDIAVSMTGTE